MTYKDSLRYKYLTYKKGIKDPFIHGDSFEYGFEDISINQYLQLVDNIIVTQLTTTNVETMRVKVTYYRGDGTKINKEEFDNLVNQHKIKQILNIT